MRRPDHLRIDKLSEIEEARAFGSHSPARNRKIMEKHGHLCNFLHPFLESLQLDFVNFLGPRLGPWPGTLQGRSTAKVTSPGQMALPTMERTPTTFRCSSLDSLDIEDPPHRENVDVRNWN